MKDGTVPLVRLAERQWGVVSRRQLLDGGLSEAGIGRWIGRGHLHRVHRGIYALGHARLSVEGHLVAALLRAGPGAALSHRTAAWWWEIDTVVPSTIHVSTPGKCGSWRGVVVHHPRRVERVRRRGLPVTSVERTLLDLAAALPGARLRKALADAEYQGLLDITAVERILGRGHRGVPALRAALEHHLPELARTRSELEERFLLLCEGAGIATPEVNTMVEGFLVDALWRDQGLVVELDGHAAHARPAAVERDRHRDLGLRSAGYVVLRYTWRQVTQQQGRLAADLRSALGTRPA